MNDGRWVAQRGGVAASEPLVSVVIPTFNYGHFVCEAVDSALAQTYSNIEVIVVDDGSTDDTRERLAKYGNRIRYHHQPNAGLSAARNKGIALANGEWIAPLDSDDVFHPRKIEIQVQYLLNHPETGVVGTAIFSEATRQWSTNLPPKHQELPVTQLTLDDFLMRTRLAPSSVLVRRKCLERSGGFDTEVSAAADRDLWIRLATRERIAQIDLPLTWYRRSPGSMSCIPIIMEEAEVAVLEKAFAMPELVRRRMLKGKAFGLAALAAARRYQDVGQMRIAFARLFESFWWWPFLYYGRDQVVPLERLRLLVALIRLSVAQLLREWAGRQLKPTSALK